MKSKRVNQRAILWALIALSFVAVPSRQLRAQEWDVRFTPYLWAAGIDGDAAIGPVSRPIDVEFADIVDVLAGAAIFRFETGNDRHALMADLVWMRLEPDDELATLGGVAEAEFDSTMLDVGYLRKFDSFDLDVGLRYWDMDLEIDPAQIRALELGDSWVDAYIGVRIVRALGANWEWQTRVNIGAGGSDSTFGLETHFARRFDNDNRFVVGFKALGFDYEDFPNATRLKMDTTFLGGTIGYMFD